jgi:hypothetical protein
MPVLLASTGIEAAPGATLVQEAKKPARTTLLRRVLARTRRTFDGSYTEAHWRDMPGEDLGLAGSGYDDTLYMDTIVAPTVIPGSGSAAASSGAVMGIGMGLLPRVAAAVTRTLTAATGGTSSHVPPSLLPSLSTRSLLLSPIKNSDAALETDSR